MKAIILRRYSKLYTKGIFLCVENDFLHYHCLTLELPNLDNECKISCIPEGIYKVDKITSPKFGMCFYLHDVPGRSGILIHKGNYAAGLHVDTLGCILPGLHYGDLNADQIPDITDSTKAFNKLMFVLPSTFELTIKAF